TRSPRDGPSGASPRNSLISARLILFAQIFLSDLLVRFGRHLSMPPKMKTECSDPTQDRHHSAKKKPDRDCHVFGRFSILCAVAKRTRQRLSNRRKNKQQKSRQNLRFHVMIRSRFILRWKRGR